jgi:hypothetical protein
MSNASGPGGDQQSHPDDEGMTAGFKTEAFASSPNPADAAPAETPERRFTAPSPSDAGQTQIIGKMHEPATEVMPVSEQPADAASAFTEPIAHSNIAHSNNASPQVIPGRGDAPKPAGKQRSWGWVIAVVLVIGALVALAILGTVLLTRDGAPKVSQQDLVRQTIQNFDTAIQKGDLATLRSVTCGDTAVNYVQYNDAQWEGIHAKVAAARQYPVVASIDQVVVNGSHAEANVTSFMAFDPATRSTRSFDLEFRDDQWKICQAPQ